MFPRCKDFQMPLAFLWNKNYWGLKKRTVYNPPAGRRRKQGVCICRNWVETRVGRWQTWKRVHGWVSGADRSHSDESRQRAERRQVGLSEWVDEWGVDEWVDEWMSGWVSEMLLCVRVRERERGGVNAFMDVCMHASVCVYMLAYHKSVMFDGSW